MAYNETHPTLKGITMKKIKTAVATVRFAVVMTPYMINPNKFHQS